MLAEYLKELAENSLNLEAAISGRQEIRKNNVVECLRLIGKEDISRILNNKQGTIIPPYEPITVISLVKTSLRV